MQGTGAPAKKIRDEMTSSAAVTSWGLAPGAPCTSRAGRGPCASSARRNRAQCRCTCPPEGLGGSPCTIAVSCAKTFEYVSGGYGYLPSAISIIERPSEPHVGRDGVRAEVVLRLALDSLGLYGCCEGVS